MMQFQDFSTKGTSSPHALIVDDNDDIAGVLEQMLASVGFQTHVAHHGVEALKKANEIHPNVILLDIHMPKLDGYDTCGVLRALPWAKTTRLIAVTGEEVDEISQRAQKAGFDAYLLKPIEFENLKKVLTLGGLPHGV